ncbi:hypothetical protein [Leptolyngbya ohadii]|uniref:hypothetical protein n=1 Tax=Leptolyngbya ohadii TaxID=1962290 RepID=UPI000B5A0E3C|nr:hypothetical protein [Leptolyngbya ohadii]
MFILTLAEIAQFRSQLSEDPIALRALDMIEDCEGDLEDAAITLALQVGQEPNRSDQWLDGLAKRWRVFICQSEARSSATEGSIAELVKALSVETTLPSVLATPIAIYVAKTGVEGFCKPLEEKL